jgi:hypothetical protein
MSVTTERSVIIVGPGRGCGLELAQAFSSAGFRLGLVGKRSDGACRRIQCGLSTDIPLRVALADVGDPEKYLRALDDLMDALPPLAALVYGVRDPPSVRMASTLPAGSGHGPSVAIAGISATVECLGRACATRSIPPPTIVLLRHIDGYADPDRPRRSASDDAFLAAGQLARPVAAQAGMHVATVDIWGGVGSLSGPSPQGVAECVLRAAADRSRFEWTA